MNFEISQEMIEERLKKTLATFKAKGSEYKIDSSPDRFAHFEEIQNLLPFALPAIAVMTVLKTKQTVCINEMIASVMKGKCDFTKEYIEEKFGDEIVYMCLLEMFIKEQCGVM